MKIAKFGLTAVMAVAVITVAMVRQARADVTFNGDIPIKASVVNPCNGETVVLTGSGHEVVRLTLNGNTIHAGVHVDVGGVSGVGLTTGAKYSVSDSFNDQFNLFPGETETAGENYHLIAHGQAPNFVAHALFHITINANGDVTSFIDIVTTDCH
jgi:hypothetical protein